MDTFRHQKSPSSERFLGLFSQHEALAAAGTNGSVGVELDENEVLWTGNDFPPDSPPATANPNHGSFLSPSSSRSFRRLPEKNFGILAALPEDDKKRALRNPSFLQRKTSISSSSSTSTSPSSSARMIPAIPKPKQEYSLSVTVGKMHHQSAPVNVPVGPRKLGNGVGEHEMGEEVEADNDADDDEMLHPHEIVARASGKESPMTTFSVLEGAGRTLKGRDLRRVRNAVWRQTGFLD